MKIHLVFPARQGTTRTRPGMAVTPPLGLAAVAALTPRDVEVSLTDENLQAIDFQQAADLAAISTTTQTAVHAYEIADRFRALGKTVVMGGLHPSALPAEACEHADAAVVGEAEGVWPALLEDFQAGRLKAVYRNQQHPRLEGVPVPRRDLFKRKRYFIPETVYTTRGCPFGCSFCAVTSFFGGTYRCRPVEAVMREIDGLETKRLILIVDDNIHGHAVYAKKLFSALASRKIAWIGQASITIARDESLLSMAAASGCKGIFLGIESISPDSLRSVGKGHNKVAEYEEAVRRIHAHGITIVAGFMFGLDHDTEDVFECTVRFAQRVRLDAAQFSILTPYPGTPLMDSLEAEGRILTRDWNQYREDRVVFVPKLMSARRLLEGHAWAWHEFYRLGSIWHRIGITGPYSPLVWVLNLQHKDDLLSRLLFDRAASWVSSYL